MEYILAIAEEGNILKAASKVYITQSALSQQLILLEEELGCRLFDRTPKGLRITPAGEIYCNGAREILQIKESVYNSIKVLPNDQESKYTIGVSFYSGMVALLDNSEKLSDKFPQTSFSFIEDSPKALLKMLNTRRLDIAILSWSDLSGINNPYIIIGEEEIFLAAQKGLIPAAEKSLEIRDFINKPLILSKPGSAMRSITDNMLKSAKQRYSVVFESNNFPLVLEMVSHNKGVAFFPESLLSPGQQSNIEFHSLNPKLIRRRIIATKNETSVPSAIVNEIKSIITNKSYI